MAHTKAGGSTRNGRDSNAQRLGVKLFGGQVAKPGDIIVRQKGYKWEPGENVKVGKDFTIFSTINGVVAFSVKKIRRFSGHRTRKTIVSVEPVK